MPDDDRISGIADALESDESGDSDEPQDSNEAHDSQDSRASKASGTQRNQDPAAFSTDEAEKTSVYGTPETLESYSTTVKDAMTRAERRGLKDATAREVHNAVLRMANEDVEAVVDLMEEERDQ